MSPSTLAGIGRFTRSVSTDLVGAVRRERSYSKGRPESALLFLTYRCTSRCRTCKMWSRAWDLKDELSLEQWMKATDALVDNGVRVIELFGGDALLRKDVLFPLIRHLKKNGVLVHIPTNCNLLDERAARTMVESGVDFLYLSVDGVDDVHDAVRGVEKTFGRVHRAVKDLVGCREERNGVRLVCNTTVSKYNFDSLEEIARFAAEAGFDEIHFEYVGEMVPEDVANSTVDGLEPTPYFLAEGESALLSPAQAKLLKEKLAAIRRQYLSSSFGITTLNIDCLSQRHMVTGCVPKGKCYTERCEVTVDPGGNVVACPFFHSFRYGNLLEDRFEDIWWGELHERFHSRLRAEGLPMCRRCILSIQRNHSFPVRLERIYLNRSRALRRKLVKVTAGDGTQSA